MNRAWIGRSRRLREPASAAFGVSPHHVIFISLHKDTDTPWLMEEALNCRDCCLTETDLTQTLARSDETTMPEFVIFST